MSWRLTSASIAGLLMCLALPWGLAVAAPPSTGAGGSSRTAPAAGPQRPMASVTNPDSPVPVPASDVPPAGRRLSADAVLAIASKLKKMRQVRGEYPGSYGGAYLKGPGRWQVSYFSRDGKKEIGQVIIDDGSGRVLEQWTGFQVAWTMARGYPGAFGRHVNALYVWLPMCLLFVAPFVRWRKPLSLLHLDLLVLLSFSVSLAFFNHGRINASVPLVYPPLVYLLIRMLVVARVGRRRAAPPVAPPGRPYGGIPVAWMAIGVLFLLGFRIGLNVTDSNVIDVGYAGVIGAERIVQGQPLYGKWPADNEHGDTYGPVNYEAYLPFEQIFGWSGRWDDLPAAHAASIFFDLLATGLLFLLGLRLRGPTLAVSLAYGWVAYPFTLYALESNSNDMIVAAFVLAALLLAGRTLARGAVTAAGALTKFAPLALTPLLATHGWTGLTPRRRARRLASFLFACAIAAAAVSVPVLGGSSLHTIYDHTIAYQLNRGSPFSIWGLYGGLGTLHGAIEIAAVALALLVALVPRRVDVIGLSAAFAAVLIALQLAVDHWFYLYIPWFFGPVMVALLASAEERMAGGVPSGARGRLSSERSGPRPFVVS